MYFVDRSVAVIKPRQPFLDWLRQVAGDDMVDVSLENLRADCTVLLLPEFDAPEQAVAYLDERADTLFRQELASWHEDSQQWPADMSLLAFWQWFDVEFHSLVLDTVDADISNTPAIAL